MTPLEKFHMLRCAAAFTIAAYGKVRLSPQALQASPREFFAKPPQIEYIPNFMTGESKNAGKTL
jgi:hypothetical protein